MATLTALEYPIRTHSGSDIGTMVVEERESGRVCGLFIPGAAYPGVERHFRYFAELVEDQCLSLTDEAAAIIDELGLIAEVDGMMVPIHDVQIYSDSAASFRYSVAATNGKHP